MLIRGPPSDAGGSRGCRRRRSAGGQSAVANWSGSSRPRKHVKRSGSPECGVAVSRSRRSVRAAELLGEHVASDVFSHVLLAVASTRRALVGLVDDHQIPLGAQQVGQDVVALGEVERRDAPGGVAAKGCLPAASEPRGDSTHLEALVELVDSSSCHWTVRGPGRGSGRGRATPRS